MTGKKGILRKGRKQKNETHVHGNILREGGDTVRSRQERGEHSEGDKSELSNNNTNV